MARSDLLLSVVRAATRGDSQLLRRSVEALIAEERAKQHHVLANRLEEQLRTNGARSPHGPEERVQQLSFEVTPQKTLGDLILPAAVRAACDELLEEHRRADLLRSYNLEPRSRILLVGPPGNGKTSLAEAIAESLFLPMFVVRYEGVIGSYLGETATRLQRLFEFVRTRRCVLFFDEFDAVAKERGDTHETGEIKRVVSSLLMQVDALPSSVIVVAATNHKELLDRAAWRRFQLRLPLPKPGENQIVEWLKKFEGDVGRPLGVPLSRIAEHLNGLSFAEVEEFGLDIKRRWVLTMPKNDLRKIVLQRMRQWAVRRSTRHRPRAGGK